MPSDVVRCKHWHSHIHANHQHSDVYFITCVVACFSCVIAFFICVVAFFICVVAFITCVVAFITCVVAFIACVVAFLFAISNINLRCEYITIFITFILKSMVFPAF